MRCPFDGAGSLKTIYLCVLVATKGKKAGNWQSRNGKEIRNRKKEKCELFCRLDEEISAAASSTEKKLQPIFCGSEVFPSFCALAGKKAAEKKGTFSPRAIIEAGSLCGEEGERERRERRQKRREGEKEKENFFLLEVQAVFLSNKASFILFVVCCFRQFEVVRQSRGEEEKKAACVQVEERGRRPRRKNELESLGERGAKRVGRGGKRRNLFLLPGSRGRGSCGRGAPSAAGSGSRGGRGGPARRSGRGGGGAGGRVRVPPTAAARGARRRRGRCGVAAVAVPAPVVVVRGRGRRGRGRGAASVVPGGSERVIEGGERGAGEQKEKEAPRSWTFFFSLSTLSLLSLSPFLSLTTSCFPSRRCSNRCSSLLPTTASCGSLEGFFFFWRRRRGRERRNEKHRSR